MEWFKLSFWIGAYGFLKEYRPEDPYITQYLTSLNFTQQEVTQDIYPVATYVSLSELIIVFLLTDWLRYKPVIVLHALSGVMMQVILIWCRKKFAMYLEATDISFARVYIQRPLDSPCKHLIVSPSGLLGKCMVRLFIMLAHNELFFVFTLCVMEYCYGTMIACEVAYYTYIYAKVDKKHYQIVTSHMRAASLSGRFISSLTSQVLLLCNFMTITELNHLTLAGMSFALLWALTLPPVKTSMYFHRTSSAVNFSECTKTNAGHTTITCISDIEAEQPVLTKICGNNVVLSRLWTDFKHAYTNVYVLKWSLWWAFATCGYTLYMTYVQVLWQTIYHQDDRTVLKHNGAVEAIYTLISALASFCFGYVKADWKVYGELLLGVCTLSAGFLIFWSSHMTVIWHAYLVYIIFGMLYQVMMTISNSEVARNIHSDSYALIFGINGFVALSLQAIMTAVITGRGGLQLNPRDQFMVYGTYFIILGVIFCLKALFVTISNSLQYTIS